MLAWGCCMRRTVVTAFTGLAPITTPSRRRRLHQTAQWDEKHTSWNFDVRKGPIHIEWFKGGLTNICYNALDRCGSG